MANEIQARQKITFSAFVTSTGMKNKINEIVGDDKKGARFVSAIISAVSTNPTLAECDNASILSGALLGESLNLSPSPQLGRYYLLPFKDKTRGTICQFILGFKGYLELAQRSGQYKDINVIEIREGEYKGRNKENGSPMFEFIEDDDVREKTKIIGYMASFTLLNGFTKSLYWSKTKMEEHAKQYSAGYRGDLKNGTKYTFWSKDFDGMAFKTMLRQIISKWGVLSIEMQTAYEGDMAYIKEDGTKEYVDNIEEAEFEVQTQPNVEETVVSLDDVE